MSDPEEGFTLVELLVALAITGAAAGLLVASLSSGGLAWRRGQAAGGAEVTVAAAQMLLRERIERLAPADAEAPDAAPLTGSATGFAFLAPAADALSIPGVQRLTLALAPGGRLMLGGDAGALPLLDGVRGIELAYFGPAAGDPVPRWRARWVGNAAPPMLVRVRLGFGAGDLRRWPELIVRPAVTTAAACRVDPERGTCA